MGKKTTVIVGGLAVAAVAGGALYFMNRSKATAISEERESDAFKNPLPAQRETREETMGENVPSRVYSFQANEDNERMIEEALKEQEKIAQSKHETLPQMSKEGVTNFPSLGLSVQLHGKWQATEEMSPMPNVAVVNFTRPEFEALRMQQTPENIGGVPVVLLSIEDISAEGMSLADFKEKSKIVALQQMAAMTGGMFAPEVTQDAPLTVGEFKHCIEYVHNTPYFQLQVINLLTVKDGLAYVMQLMANPEVVARERTEIMKVAQSLVLSPHPRVLKFYRETYLDVFTGHYNIKIPTTWTVENMASTPPVVARFKTISTKYPEWLTLYKLGDAPKTAGFTKLSGKTIGGVEIETFKNPNLRFFSNDAFTLVVSAEGRSIVEDDFCIECLKTAKTSTQPSQLIFVNVRDGYQFEATDQARFIESRIARETILYAPCGISQDTDVPLLTIRVGDPAADPECMESLDEWFMKLKEESGTSVQGLAKETFNGAPCVTFFNKEMQEVGPGQSEERQARIYIFVRNHVTTLLRWECSTGSWPKHERKFTRLMDSFHLI